MITKYLALENWLEYQSFEKNTLVFTDEISRYELEEFLLQLLEIERKEYVENIIVYLSSPGGDAYSAFALYDMLKHFEEVGVRVKIICMGLVASAAAMIVLQAATTRRATKNTRFLLHEIKRWAFLSNERVSELEDELGELRDITDRVVELLAKRCDQSEKTVRKLIERKEIWMSAEQALEWHLIDEII